MTEIFPKDPSAETDHLNPDGSHKHHKVDRAAQGNRFWQRQQREANVVIDPKLPVVEPTEKKETTPYWEH